MLVWITLFLFVRPSEPTGKVHNAAEFTALCRLLSMAEEINKPGSAEKYVNDSIDWNTPVAELARIHDYIEATNSSDPRTVRIDDSHQVRLTDPVRKGVLRQQLFVASLRMNNLKKKLWDLRDKANADYIKAAGFLKTAAVSEGDLSQIESEASGFAPTQTRSSSRQTTCGGASGPHGQAGKNLVTDLMCICAAQAGGQTQPCGFDAGDGSGQKWDANEPAGNAPTIWKAIHSACTQRRLHFQVSPAGLTMAIQAFRGLIGVQAGNDVATGTDGVHYFGHIASSQTNCDGTAGAGVCVIYKGSGAETTVGWLNSVNEARESLADLEKKLSEGRRIVSRVDQISESVLNAMVYANATQLIRPAEPTPLSSSASSGSQPHVVDSGEKQSQAGGNNERVIEAFTLVVIMLFLHI